MKKCSLNKRALFSNNDNNSLVVYTCDSCGLFKSHLSMTIERKERGYLCEYCSKTE